MQYSIGDIITFWDGQHFRVGQVQQVEQRGWVCQCGAHLLFVTKEMVEDAGKRVVIITGIGDWRPST